MNASNPDLILDVLFEKGILFFVLKNLGDGGAQVVRFEFSHKIVGVNGKIEITALNIFHKLQYLAPQKEIKIFIDTAASYFQAKQPKKFAVTINWKDENKKTYSRSITHNLEIYEDFGYLNPIE